MDWRKELPTMGQLPKMSMARSVTTKRILSAPDHLTKINASTSLSNRRQIVEHGPPAAINALTAQDRIRPKSRGLRSIIEPSLMSPMSTAVYRPSSAATGTSAATRPPVIGRELPLDPERSTRYSSSDDQLKAYLATLQRKSIDTTAEKPIELGQQQPSSGNFSRFLKKASAPVDKKVVVEAPKYLSTPQTVSNYAASNALQRAQFITSKFDVKKTTMINPASSSWDHHSNDLLEDQTRLALEESAVDVKDLRSDIEKQASSDTIITKSKVDNNDCDDDDYDDQGHLSHRVGSFLNIGNLEDLLSDDDVGQQLQPQEKQTGSIHEIVPSESSASKLSIKSTDILHYSSSSSDRSKPTDVDHLAREASADLQETIASEVVTEEEVVDQESDVIITSQEESKTTKTAEKQLASTSKSIKSSLYSSDFEEESLTASKISSTASKQQAGTTSLLQPSSNENNHHVQRIAKTSSPRRTSSQKLRTASKEVQTSASFELQAHRGLVADPIPIQFTTPKVPLASFIDPQRISTHLISNDTLTTLSSYSPVMMALNELLRHQVRNTRSFVESQRRIYMSVVESLRPDHEYTTWINTEQLISNQRSRRKTKT